MRNLILAACASGLFAAAPFASAADNGVGFTPAMGWNSWKTYGKSYSHTTVENQAKDLLAQISGQPAGTTLFSLGYNTLAMDSGWRDESGTDNHGFAKPDLSKFPNGIPGISNYVHTLNSGLKLGIYLTPGILKAGYDGKYPIDNTLNPATGKPYTTQDIVVKPLTNGNTENSSGASYSYAIDFTKPGAVQWLQNYANMLANDWQVDYIMFDFVGPGGGNIPCDDRTNMQEWLTVLENTHRPIWIKLSNSLKFANAATWQQVANSWRIDGDVHGTWTDISNRMADSPQWAPYEGRTFNGGGWGDMDSLLVGNANNYKSTDERRTAVTLWSVCCSPLILGQDLGNLKTGDIPLITNPEVIAVDQAGIVATPNKNEPSGVWQANNPDGTFTVAIFNTTGSTISGGITYTFSGSADIRDLWARKDLGVFTGSFNTGSINSHACRLIKLTLTSQQRVAAPVFSPPGGAIGQTVTITSATSGASIRYTTDGTDPSETQGTVYSGPVYVSTPMTLKAIAYEAGMTDSAITSATYGTLQTYNFEAESLTYTPAGATASVQTDTNSSGGKWIELAATGSGQSIDYAISGLPAGTYQLQMEWKGNNSRGILQLAVDGANLGPTLDQYSSGQTYPTTPFGTVTFPTTGPHTVRLTVTGKNGSSSHYYLSADKFIFVAQ